MLRGGGDTTGITSNNSVPNDIAKYNQDVLNTFHEELIKLLNRHNITVAGSNTVVEGSTRVDSCYCAPNGYFVKRLSTTNSTLNDLKGDKNYLLTQDIKNNKRIKKFLETNDINCGDATTIGDFVSNVMDACQNRSTKLKHIKRMSKSKEHELAEQYLVLNLLEANGNKFLPSRPVSEFNTSWIKNRALGLSNKKTLRQQNIPFYERFFDKINRLWFSWMFKKPNCNHKEQYWSLCGRDWDTGKPTR